MLLEATMPLPLCSVGLFRPGPGDISPTPGKPREHSLTLRQPFVRKHRGHLAPLTPGLKGIFNDLDPQGIGLHFDRYDIEAAELMCLAPLGPINLRGFHQMPLLLDRHSVSLR